MATPLLTPKSIQPLKKSNSAFLIRNIQIRHRNYSNSKHGTLNTIEPEQSKQIIPQIKQLKEETKSASRNKGSNGYYLDRLKGEKVHEQHNVIRKNRSLKKLNNGPNSQLSRDKEIESENLLREINEQKVPPSKGVAVSIKRRVQLIKSKQNKLKLIESDKERQRSKEQPRSEASIGERVDCFIPEQENKYTSNQIQSENILGSGLKKHSSSKIKILVKNPFEKLMRLDQNKKEQSANIQSFQQSLIPFADHTGTSFAYRSELEDLLALI